VDTAESARREGGLERRAALAAINVLQSSSVFAMRGESTDVRDDGDGGRDSFMDGAREA